MREETFQLNKGGDPSRLFDTVSRALETMNLIVVVKERRKRRSEQQNRYLWGCVYPAILKHLPGWDPEDIHEFCLGSWSGWEIVEGLGKRRQRPVRRSSALSTVEFMEFVAHIQRTMAERGIDVPDPGESLS